MKVVMGLCQRIAVLDYGVKIAEGDRRRRSRRPEGHRGVPRRGPTTKARMRRQSSEPMLATRHARNLAVAMAPSPRSRGISFAVAQGEIVTLIGANGAGKTTTLRTISGLLAPTAGDDRRSSARTSPGSPAHEIVARGLCHVPEGRDDLREPHRRREPRDGRLPAERPAERIAEEPRVRLQRLSPAAGARQADGRHALGRRAADARHRPRADGQPRSS